MGEKALNASRDEENVNAFECRDQTLAFPVGLSAVGPHQWPKLKNFSSKSSD